jgi:hypothetical protein
MLPAMLGVLPRTGEHLVSWYKFTCSQWPLLQGLIIGGEGFFSLLYEGEASIQPHVNFHFKNITPIMRQGIRDHFLKKGKTVIISPSLCLDSNFMKSVITRPDGKRACQVIIFAECDIYFEIQLSPPSSF